VPGSALSATAGLPASGCGQVKLVSDRSQIAPLAFWAQRSKSSTRRGDARHRRWPSVSPLSLRRISGVAKIGATRLTPLRVISAQEKYQWLE